MQAVVSTFELSTGSTLVLGVLLVGILSTGKPIPNVLWWTVQQPLKSWESYWFKNAYGLLRMCLP